MKILRDRQGYTLIEMTIVLFIILAFLAMSIPFFANFSGSTGLKTAEREISTILRTGRSYAISQNKNYNVVFDTLPTPNTYSIRDAATPTQPIDKLYQLPAGVTFTAATTVTFTSNGGLASGTYVSSPVVVTITSTKGSRTISVDAATGAVTMQ
jgi:prepilin-type N-terminal cleavage/methylation domain-containing protein